MKTILITGASGFLGFRLYRHFSSADLQGQYRAFPIRGRTPDICDRDALMQCFAEAQPDYVIHCAAVSDTGRCQREPEKSYAVNVCGAENVAAACRNVGAKLIFCSSDQVYFGECIPHSGDLSPHRESEKLKPAGVYGFQKLEAESRCAAACPDTVSLRLSWMYDTGAPGPEKHGDLYTTLKQFAGSLKSGADLSFPVHDYRSITHAADVARQMEAALNLPPGVYNFAAAGGKSAYETAREFLARMGCPEAAERLRPDFNRFADKPRNMRMDTEKAARYGIHFPETLEGFCRALYGSAP